MLLYLAVSASTINEVLIREEEGAQWPMYYVIKPLLNTETHYLDMIKVALALVTVA